jgi:hypothetical protein
MVWNSLVGSEGDEDPTTLFEIIRNLYSINGTSPVTVSVVASGSDTSNTGTQVAFLAVQA